MRTTLVTLVLIASTLHARDWAAGSFSKDANHVLRIVQALVGSKARELTPRTYEHDGLKYSCHLSSVRHLGAISRDSETFSVATALFIRSSPEDGELPPARGHGFLLLLDRKGRIASCCRLDFPDQVELIDRGKLRRIGKLPFEQERETIGDLGASDIPTRSRGYLIDGAAFLPYPFPDRMTEPDDAGKSKD